MQPTPRRLALTATLTLAIAACGGDSVGVTSGDPLTQQEALAIFTELNDAVSDALGGVAAPAASSGATMDAIPTVTGDCSAGGSVTVSGDADADINQSTMTGSVSFSLTESINGCALVYNSIRFTVNGDPNIKINGDLDIGENFNITGTYEMKGGFEYDADDSRSGTCGVDVNVNFTNLTASGSFCGQSLGGS